MPPESSPISALAVEVQLRQRRLDPLLPVPGVERLDPGLQGVEVVAGGVRLVALAHHARLGDALPTASNTDISGSNAGSCGT